MRLPSFLRLRRRPTPNTSVEDLIGQAGIRLDPFQRVFLDHWISINPPLLIPAEAALANRRAMRREARERMVAIAVALGEHVHVMSADPETGRSVLTCPLNLCTVAELTVARTAMEGPRPTQQVVFDEAHSLTADDIRPALRRDDGGRA